MPPASSLALSIGGGPLPLTSWRAPCSRSLRLFAVSCRWSPLSSPAWRLRTRLSASTHRASLRQTCRVSPSSPPPSEERGPLPASLRPPSCGLLPADAAHGPQLSVIGSEGVPPSASASYPPAASLLRPARPAVSPLPSSRFSHAQPVARCAYRDETSGLSVAWQSQAVLHRFSLSPLSLGQEAARRLGLLSAQQRSTGVSLPVADQSGTPRIASSACLGTVASRVWLAFPS